MTDRQSDPSGIRTQAISARIAEAKRLAVSGPPEALGFGLRALIDIANTHPDDAQVQIEIGKTCFDVGNAELAYRFYKAGVSLDPSNVRGWKLFATCLLVQRHYAAARIAVERALSLDPDDASACLVLANVLSFLDEPDAALAAFDRALGAKGDENTRILALCGKGKHLQSLGRLGDARDTFLAVLTRRPGSVEAIAALTGLRHTFEDPDAVIDDLKRAVAGNGLSDTKRADARFAMGSILAANGRHDEAFGAFVEGNRIRGRASQFRLDRFEAQVERLIAAFTPGLFETLVDLGHPDSRPLFIVGMPRSGTTLTEAILARHPEVAAYGERKDMPALAAALGGQSNRILTADGTLQQEEGVLRYPEDLAAMDRDALRALRDDYLAALTEGSDTGARRLTDKMPFNFLHLGLIALLFPNATILHCTRDAMATCVSCFLQNFADDLGFSTDLSTLGRYYHSYRRLMDHWKAVLPLPIHDCSYEGLVDDQEAGSRALIRAAGLAWDPACLDFQSGGFHTKTASNWQVRQKLYATALRNWEPYEHRLGALKEALGGYFEPDGAAPESGFNPPSQTR
ncbi:MAG: sulfotransferase [Pseudomonadota bacterium]